MPVPASFVDRLRARMRQEGALTVATYIAACNAHYYATRDPFGRAGDFVTAPEISQMFGELLGLWLAYLWVRAGRPAEVRYLELGPGRGTLAADALRAMRSAGLVPVSIEFVETSPVLRAAQAARVPEARWHETLAGVPGDRPLLVLANEFFDALPVRQLVRTATGWRERTVVQADEGFAWSVGADDVADAVPAPLADAAAGTIVEVAPAAAAMARDLAALLAQAGGAGLVIDYGYSGPLAGDTLQAVAHHEFVDPLGNPGEQDLTAHVDFSALAAAAAAGGATTYGPMAQGVLLDRLGIGERATALKARNRAQAAAIEAARARLILPDGMGLLFKALALTAAEWPHPAGFA